MKRFLIALLLAALMPFAAVAADCTGYNGSNCQKHGGSDWVVNGTLEYGSSAVMDTHGIPFSTVLTGNPLVQTHRDDATAVQVSTIGGKTILTGATGRTIYPSASLTVMASGTLGGSTSIKIMCSGGKTIATILAGALVDATPVGIFSSGVTAGSGLLGCASGDSVFVSNVGSAPTTTSDFFIQLPYTVQ